MNKSKPIAEYLVDFLDYLEIEKGLSNNTQKNYARFLSKFFNWLREAKLEKIRPAQLTTDHVWKYRVFLSRHIDLISKKPLKKSTQNYYLIALRSLLEFFVEKDISTLSPTKIKLAKDKSEHEVKFLKLKQLKNYY